MGGSWRGAAGGLPFQTASNVPWKQLWLVALPPPAGALGTSSADRGSAGTSPLSPGTCTPDSSQQLQQFLELNYKRQPIFTLSSRDHEHAWLIESGHISSHRPLPPHLFLSLRHIPPYPYPSVIMAGRFVRASKYRRHMSQPLPLTPKPDHPLRF